MLCLSGFELYSRWVPLTVTLTTCELVISSKGCGKCQSLPVKNALFTGFDIFYPVKNTVKVHRFLTGFSQGLSLCLWRRSLCSNLGDIGLEKLYQATLIEHHYHTVIIYNCHDWSSQPSKNLKIQWSLH